MGGWVWQPKQQEARDYLAQAEALRTAAPGPRSNLLMCGVEGEATAFCGRVCPCTIRQRPQRRLADVLSCERGTESGQGVAVLDSHSMYSDQTDWSTDSG